jgi:hypothetical protein
LCHIYLTKGRFHKTIYALKKFALCAHLFPLIIHHVLAPYTQLIGFFLTEFKSLKFIKKTIIKLLEGPQIFKRNFWKIDKFKKWKNISKTKKMKNDKNVSKWRKQKW